MITSDSNIEYTGSVSPAGMLELVGNLVTTLKQKPVDIASTRDQIGPIIHEIKESLDQSPRIVKETTDDLGHFIMPKRETMLSFVHTIELLLFRSNNTSVSPDQVKSKMLNIMAQIVLDLTEADCVLVRKLLTDDTAVLMGDPVFASGSERGFPPQIKYSSRALFMRPDHSPTVVPNLSDAGADSNLLETLRLNLQRWPSDSPEHQFISAIRAEICIPLVVNGEVPAGVVAASWKPYDAATAEKITNGLRAWQPILTYFYHYALPNSTSLFEITRSIPFIKERGTDSEFLRGAATILTSHCGLGWHRAFLYILDESEPLDAHCIMAIGGVGLPDWSVKQNEMSKAFETLSAALSEIEDPDCSSEDDALYRLLREDQESLAISSEELAGNRRLASILSCDPDQNLGYRDGSLSLVIQADDPWIRNLRVASVAFQNDASKCEHVIIPMMQHRPFRPIGFYLLDNPYVHPVGINPDLTLTAFVCGYLTELMIGRKIGLDDWFKTNVECRAVVNATMGRIENDSEYVEKVRTRKLSLCRPLRS